MVKSPVGEGSNRSGRVELSDKEKILVAHIEREED